MTLAGTSSVLESAATARVERLLKDSSASTTPRAIGIRTATEPAWPGEPRRIVEGRSVRFVACSSVLAIVTALVDWDREQDSVLTILTDRDDHDLDSGILAQLDGNRLHSVSSTTVLESALGPGYDAEIARTGWLREALTELRAAGKLRMQTGTRFTLDHAHDAVLFDRIGARLDQLDRAALLAALSRPETARRWKTVSADEHDKLAKLLVWKFGASAQVMLTLAHTTENLLPELLVADVLLREDAPTGGRLYGAFLHSRGLHRITPSDEAVREAANTTVRLVRSQLTSTTAHAHNFPGSLPVRTHLARADELLQEHAGQQFAASSDVLLRAFEQRLVVACENLTHATWQHAHAHIEPQTDRNACERLERLRSALRLKQWLNQHPDSEVDNLGQGLRRHANELAWVDRAVNHVRGEGDGKPEIAEALYNISEQARSLRRTIDLSFTTRLAHSLDRDPGSTLLVENVLREVLAPLAKHVPVLLIVIDGMSGAVAGELAEHLTDDQHPHWYEVVRGDSEQREAVLAALPTETAYSRTSLFSATLSTGTQEAEQRAFPKHRFWGRSAGAALFHKKDLPGSGGQPLGSELEAALTGASDSEEYKRVVGVVLNTVDDALTAGRQADSASWKIGDITHLRALLENAQLSGRAVVLLSDHGHVLDHAPERHASPDTATRWRTGEATSSDEVLLAGQRVLTDSGRGVFAATEHIRYGKKAHGYHGGATLAETAIPLITLLPAGTSVPKGWQVRTAGVAPGWWAVDDTNALAPAPSEPPASTGTPRRKPQPAADQDGLFAAPAVELEDDTNGTSLGQRLIATKTFTQARSPFNRAPSPGVFAAVVDALAAANGHRMPATEVARAAGQANRNPRGLIAVMTRVLNRDGYEVLKTFDNGRMVFLDDGLLHNQFLETT